MITSRQRASGNSNQELISNLKSNDVIRSASVEEALLTIPRGEFVPEGYKRISLFV